MSIFNGLYLSTIVFIVSFQVLCFFLMIGTCSYYRTRDFQESLKRAITGGTFIGVSMYVIILFVSVAGGNV